MAFGDLSPRQIADRVQAFKRRFDEYVDQLQELEASHDRGVASPIAGWACYGVYIGGAFVLPGEHPYLTWIPLSLAMGFFLFAIGHVLWLARQRRKIMEKFSRDHEIHLRLLRYGYNKYSKPEGHA